MAGDVMLNAKTAGAMGIAHKRPQTPPDITGWFG